MSQKDNSGNIISIKTEYIIGNQVALPIVILNMDPTALKHSDDSKRRSTEQTECLLSVSLERSFNRDIDKTDEDGCTSLYKVTSRGHLLKVINLVESGADPNTENEDGRRALHVAAEEGHRFIVHFLVNEGADVNAQCNLRKTALHAAIHNNQCFSAIFLIWNGADVYKRDNCGRTPLHMASAAGNIHIFEHLADKTWDINVKDDMGLTVLHHAVRYGHFNIVNYLLKKGAEETPYGGDSLIFVSASFGNLDLVKLFISRGGDVNEENSIGQNPLHVAASKGYLDITKCLIEEGCDINNGDHEDFTPVHGAVSNGHLDVLEYLITQQAKITKYDGKSVLHLAAIHGHLDILRYFMKMGADVSELDDSGQTPLHVAAGMGHFDVVKYLIEQESKTDKQDHLGYAPLHIAAAKGQLEIVKYLADQHCYVKEFDNKVLTPLTLAAKHGHLDTVKYLADGKADETNSLCEAALSGHLDIVKFFMNRTELRLAASYGHLDTVKYLVQQGVDIDSSDEKGWTPLEYAIQNNNCEVIDYLLANGAKANQDKEESPLYMASRLGHLDGVNVLISRGISVNAESLRGQIPIHAAAASGRIQVVETLIQNGSDLNKTDIDGWTPLHAAVQNGHLEVVKYLKRKGAIDMKNRGMTSLYTAAQHGHLDIVDLFLSNGADLNEEDDTGCIALHAAAANGSLEIVQKLINHGSNVNKMAENGWTPLHAAVHSGRLDIVRYLISYGATKTRFKGMTVLYIAAQRGHTDLLEYFVTTGCDVNDGTDSGKTPLLAACYNGHIDSVKMLVTQGACINQSDRNKWTPVHAAAQKGHWQVATYLVENGADTNAKDIDGMTPIQAADDGGPGIFITSFRWYLKRLRAEMHDERHNVPCKNFRSDGNCTEVFGGSGLFKVPACDSLSGINGESYYPIFLNVTTVSIPMQGAWRNDPDTILRHIKTATRPKRVSCVTQLHVNGGEVSATNDMLITDEDDAVDPKAGTKSERRNKENCFSIPALLHRAILALVFYFSCFPILVAGNLRLTEPVTLEVGTRGVVTFYLERPSSTLQFSLFYNIQFGSKGRPFCINGQNDADGFKDPSQESRYTTTVTDRDTSPCVNMTIDDVHTIDGDQYIFIGVWRSSDIDLYDTQKKEVVVERPPGPTDCFITLSDHGDSEFPYELHCSAKTGSMPTTLTCYQNDRDLVKVHNITDNGLTIRAIFFLPDTTRFSCCSHDIISTVDVANCNDFEWPPYSGIPSTEKTTSRSMFVGEQSNWPTDPRPKTNTVGSGACSPIMIPSQWHFLYLLIYLLVFVVNFVCQ